MQHLQFFFYLSTHSYLHGNMVSKWCTSWVTVYVPLFIIYTYIVIIDSALYFSIIVFSFLLLWFSFLYASCIKTLLCMFKHWTMETSGHRCAPNRVCCRSEVTTGELFSHHCVKGHKLHSMHNLRDICFTMGSVSMSNHSCHMKTCFLIY